MHTSPLCGAVGSAFAAVNPPMPTVFATVARPPIALEVKAANLLRQVSQDRQRMAALMTRDPHCATCGQYLTRELRRDNTAILDVDMLKCRQCIAQGLQEVQPEQHSVRDSVALATALADLERPRCLMCGRSVKPDAPACYRHLTIVLMRGFRKGGRAC